MKILVRVSAVLLPVLVLGACNLPNKIGTQASLPAVTTAAAPKTSYETSKPTETEPAATKVFTGSPPGDPPNNTASWLTDAQTPSNAKNDYAVIGDDYSHNQFERPFDKELAYRPDLDILSATLTLDSQWYYVTIKLDGTDTAKDALIACYGIELDVNIDGRGEFVIWAQPPFTTTWARENIVVYGSLKGTVGGPQPLLSDAPWKGDTYDTVLFDEKTQSDMNAAWARVSPGDPKGLQIAFSPEILQKPNQIPLGRMGRRRDQGSVPVRLQRRVYEKRSRIAV